MRSATGFAFTFNRDAVVYMSKTQLINVLIFKKADPIYDVTTAKTARFLRFMIW